MKAAIFEKPGLENLKVIDNVEKPRIDDHSVLIKVKTTGINPIDHFVVSGALPKIEPIPHIPGAESSGIVRPSNIHYALGVHNQFYAYTNLVNQLNNECSIW